MNWYLHSMRDERSPVNLPEGSSQLRDHFMVTHVVMDLPQYSSQDAPFVVALWHHRAAGSSASVLVCVVFFGSIPD